MRLLKPLKSKNYTEYIRKKCTTFGVYVKFLTLLVFEGYSTSRPGTIDSKNMCAKKNKRQCKNINAKINKKYKRQCEQPT